MLKSAKKNSEEIRRHFGSSTHQKVIQYLRKKKMLEIETALKKAQKRSRQEKPELEVTSKMFRDRSNIPSLTLHKDFSSYAVASRVHSL